MSIPSNSSKKVGQNTKVAIRIDSQEDTFIINEQVWSNDHTKLTLLQITPETFVSNLIFCFLELRIQLVDKAVNLKVSLVIKDDFIIECFGSFSKIHYVKFILCQCSVGCISWVN